MSLSGGSNNSVAGNTQERPVVFQKYFKSGNKTYASQVKLASNGRKYLVITEGVRDPETHDVKKHYIRVFDQDLKEFFAMLQETVLYLRSTKDSSSSAAGVRVVEPIPEPASAKASANRPAATKPELVSGKPAAQPKMVAQQKIQKISASPAPKNTRYAKPATRPASARPAGR